MNKQEVEKRVSSFIKMVADNSDQKISDLIDMTRESIKSYEGYLLRELSFGLNANEDTVESYTNSIIELREKMFELNQILRDRNPVIG